MDRFAFLDDALGYWAIRTPNADALSLVGQTISFAQLEDKVNDIADMLLQNGVKRGDRVVIFAAKSFETLAAVFATLRVGALYVPVDPAAPRRQIETRLNNVDPVLILSDTARLPVLVEIGNCVPSIDMLDAAPSCQNIAKIKRRSALRRVEDGAYILHTSGSTGTPKGILHTHKSGMAYASMATDLCQLSACDRVSHMTPLHFDMSIFDVFASLLVGATTVIIPEMYAKLPASLGQIIEDEKITVWYSVPYAISQMVTRGALHTRDLSSLRCVMFAGEKMLPSDLKAFAQHIPDAQFLNAYGPTETNHCVTARLSYRDLDGVSPLPIGLPDAGVHVRIGDGALTRSEGELLVASPQNMTGYWNAHEQTTRCMCSLTDKDGITRTYYKTGDIVRRNADGTLTLVGRRDRQIKLRGFRIELDEVELALTNLDGIAEAAVGVWDDAIHAYVSGPAAKNHDGIRAALAEVLSTYAHPTSYISLDVLPRTSTGKIDRVALGKQFGEQYAA